MMAKLYFFLIASVVLMNSVLIADEKIDLPLQQETEHFQIYCKEQDRDVALAMIDAVEKRFEEITSRYGYVPSSRIRIGIYPDSHSFREATGMLQASPWYNEKWGDGSMWVLSPNVPNQYHSFKSRAVLAPMDTFVGTIVYDRYGKAPSWLHIGVPLFESGRWVVEEKEFAREIMKGNIEKKGFPTLKDLESDEYPLRCSPFDATLVAYIVQTKGFDALLALLEDYSLFEEILGQSKEEVREGWIEFLQKEYFEA